MANSAQARKRARQAVKNRAHNASLRTAFRTAVKKVLKAVEAGDKAAAQSVFRDAVKVLDRIAGITAFADQRPRDGRLAVGGGCFFMVA